MVEESVCCCLHGGCYLLNLRPPWIEIIEAVVNKDIAYFLPEDIHCPLVISNELFAIVTQKDCLFVFQ